MKLTIRDDGFGYDAAGQRYWRASDGCWLRAYMSPTPVSLAQLPSQWVTGSNGRPRYVAYRNQGENHVTICEAT